jgi:hypothetical protein
MIEIKCRGRKSSAPEPFPELFLLLFVQVLVHISPEFLFPFNNFADDKRTVIPINVYR